MTLKLRDFLTLGFLVISASVYSQESNMVSITYGAGVGFSSFNEKVSGFGPDLNIGLNYKSKFDKLRINPNLQIGNYLSGESDNKRDEYFNCFNLDFLIDLTLIRIKAFSLNIQTGGFMGKSRGLIGTGTEFDNATSTDIDFSTSQFLNNFNFGFKMGGGLLYTPPKGRLSYGFYPINITYGSNGFRGLHARLGLAVQLFD